MSQRKYVAEIPLCGRAWLSVYANSKEEAKERFKNGDCYWHGEDTAEPNWMYAARLLLEEIEEDDD